MNSAPWRMRSRPRLSVRGVPEYRVNYVVQEMTPTFAFLRRFLGTASLEAASPYGEFAQRVSRLLSIVQGISQPRANGDVYAVHG